MNLANRTLKSRIMVGGVIAVLILAIGDAAGAERAQQPPPDDWTHSEHDAGGSNFNPGESRLNAANVSRLRPVWRSGTSRFSTWVVSAGRVFRFDGVNVVAARRYDGSTLWDYRYDDCWVPYNAVARPRRVFVYFDDGCSQTGATDEALVTAFDARTGDVLWEVGPSQWVLSMRLVRNHLVLETEGPFGMTSLDPATGGVQWSNGDDTLDGAVAVDGRHVYFAGWDYNADQRIVASYSLADGNVVWSRPLAVSYAFGLSVGGQGLFIEGADETTLETLTIVVDKATGSTQYDLPGVTVAGYQPGLLFTEAGNSSGATTNALQARRAATGKLLWTRRAGGTWYRLALANGLAYAARQSGSRTVLYIYSTGDGRVVLMRRLPYDRVLAVTGGTLYLGRSEDGAVVALRPGR